MIITKLEIAKQNVCPGSSVLEDMVGVFCREKDMVGDSLPKLFICENLFKYILVVKFRKSLERCS